MRERKRDTQRERGGVIKGEYKSNVCRKEELYMYKSYYGFA